ncbi:MAG: hypothetical protein DCF22_01230 [Leptolyngbya sp.]|nr:MAG: hypothetical protein DCF22_01230 [Leptolyngbya sp.]
MVTLRSMFQKVFIMGSAGFFLSTAFLVDPQSSSAQGFSRTPTLMAKRPKNASNNFQGGAVRGECPVGKKSLMALIPAKDIGQTTQAYPTFWFYLPFGKTTFTPSGESEVTVASAKFVLLDEDRKPVLKQPLILLLPDKEGIVKLTLPKTEKALQAGKDYQWFFSIVCDAEQPSSNPTISGWLTRVPTNTKPAKQTKTTQPQAVAKSDFWLEYLNQVATTRTQNPAAWSDLLKSFGLQELAGQPVSELKSATK